MRKGRKTAVFLAVVSSLSLPIPLAAEETSRPCYWNGTTRKLGRGVANVVSAPLEMIRTPYFVGQRDGGLASITVGLVQGLGATVIRELAGIIEVATFFAPLPKKDFQPFLHPEFVYGHGDWVP